MGLCRLPRLLLLCAALTTAGARFHVPATSAAEQVALREGADLLARFEENAAAEALPSALGRLMGKRGCWHEAVATLRADCRSLDDDSSRRLALTLANCQLEASGLKPYPCAPTQSLKDCTGRMTDKAWTSYSAAIGQASAVCFFITAESFQADALASVDRLQAASRTAADKLDSLGDGMASALALQERMAQSQAHLADGLRAVGEAQAGLEQMQLAALDGTASLLSGQHALAESAESAAVTLAAVHDTTQSANATISALFVAHHEAAASTLRSLQALGEGAALLEAAQQRFGQAQGELLASSRLVVERQAALAASLDAVGSTIDGLALWQERCARGLGLLLGSTFGLADGVWTAAAIGGSMLSTAIPHTQAARPLLLLSVGASAAAERTLIPWLVTSTQAAQAVLSAGAALASNGVDSPRAHGALFEFAAQLERAEVKWSIRKGALWLCGALLLRAVWRHTDAHAARVRAQAAADERLQRTLDDALMLHERRMFEALRNELSMARRGTLQQPRPAFAIQDDMPLWQPPARHLALQAAPTSPAVARLAYTSTTPGAAPRAAGVALPTTSPCGDAAAGARAVSEPLRGVRLAPVLELASAEHAAVGDVESPQPAPEPAPAQAAAAAAAPPAPPAAATRSQAQAQSHDDASSMDSKQRRKRAPDAEPRAPPAKRAASLRARSGQCSGA